MQEVTGTKSCQYEAFPILIKFIDPGRILSIQVHPGQVGAEHEKGSMEDGNAVRIFKHIRLATSRYWDAGLYSLSFVRQR